MFLNQEIEKLYNYKGSNPKPEDFDEFWDTAVEEVKKIDPEVELKPAKQKFKGCEAFDMYFTGMGGARIHAKYMRPENVKNAPVIYMFHGYGGNAGSWYALLGAVSQGYCVAALDCRGPYAGINCFFRVEDPTHEREDEIFTRLGYIDIQNMAPRIKCRMLMMTGLLDNICPPLTQFAAYNKITSEKKVMIYPEYGHEELPEHMEIALDWFSK